MQFGIVLPSYLPQATVDGMRRTALLAEELGFDAVWSTDHVMTAADTPAPYQSIYEGLHVLTWLAGLTSRVKLGVSVLIMTQRHPVLIAKEVATMDAVSNGRIILGLGVGWAQVEFDYLNADFHHRGAILNEGIRVLRSLWTDPSQPFHGRFFHFENQSFAPPPVQPGGPPIWIGGHSQAAIKRAATLADGWHATGTRVEDFRAGAQEVRRLADGRPVVISIRSTVSSQGGGLRTGPRGQQIYVLGGSPNAMRDDVFRYQEAGCEYMALNFWEGDLEASLDSMRRFAGEVISKIG